MPPAARSGQVRQRMAGRKREHHLLLRHVKILKSGVFFRISQIGYAHLTPLQQLNHSPNARLVYFKCKPGIKLVKLRVYGGKHFGAALRRISNGNFSPLYIGNIGQLLIGFVPDLHNFSGRLQINLTGIAGCHTSAAAHKQPNPQLLLQAQQLLVQG
ncbi:hypothetical protein SDC9_95209 [bioreactor metagenome]|uniref:Uncharacterized protein n=1 Tax=bioreactor metagenome TaxID=1076179 RepID=A0A645AFN7_9ZZZZ